MKRQVCQLIKRLARDERGFASAVGLIFLFAILVIGVIVGLVTVRDHIVTEFGDVAVALDNLSQSFSYTISVDGNNDGDFIDPADTVLTAMYTDDAATLMDLPDAAPACLNLDVAPINEGDTPTAPTGAFP